MRYVKSKTGKLIPSSKEESRRTITVFYTLPELYSNIYVYNKNIFLTLPIFESFSYFFPN